MDADLIVQVFWTVYLWQKYQQAGGVACRGKNAIDRRSSDPPTFEVEINGNIYTFFPLS